MLSHFVYELFIIGRDINIRSAGNINFEIFHNSLVTINDIIRAPMKQIQKKTFAARRLFHFINKNKLFFSDVAGAKIKRDFQICNSI